MSTHQTPHQEQKKQRANLQKQSAASSKQSGSGTKMAVKEARRQIQRRGRKTVTKRLT